MKTKLKGTNCRKIFQAYFTGRLDLSIQLCEMNVSSKFCKGIPLETYTRTIDVETKQRHAIQETLLELDDQSREIITNSFKDNGETAETLAHTYNISTHDISKIILKFRQAYAEHGGTDKTEKQLLQPILDYKKAKEKHEKHERSSN